MLDLPHVASRLFGTPLMIARAKLEVILGVIGPRLTGSLTQPVLIDSSGGQELSITAEGIAVVSIIGTLVSRSSYVDAASGLASYGELGDAISAAFDDPAVRGIVLEIDSPGGEVGGLFDLVERIGALKTSTGKPLSAVANEAALSAAYAIASTADRIYVTQTGEVGSIGVVAAHVDESSADAKAGLAWTFMFAGERKIDGNAHQPLSGVARDAIQADIDQLYEQFASLVAKNRGLTPEEVRGTEAAIFRGQRGLRAGLADRIGTIETAVADMAAELDPPTSTQRMITKRSPSMAKSKTEPVAVDAATEPQLPLPSQEISGETAPAAPPPIPERASEAQAPAPERAPQPTGEASAADRLRAEFAEIATIAAQASRLGVSLDAAEAMAKGISADALRRSVLEALAARAEATSVIAAAPSQPAAGDSAIVRRAKERAAAARA
ncbi:MAG: S49 family peptidase [Hyphomicrobiales bacterium]|nr:S49 family peptidase [Hyphomicrobiales bacterium]